MGSDAGGLGKWGSSMVVLKAFVFGQRVGYHKSAKNQISIPEHFSFQS
jgi:hypothetical protein